MRILTAFTAICLLQMPLTLWGSDSESESLKGIGPVEVVVVVSTEAEQDGLRAEDIKTDAELKLRLAGLRATSALNRLTISINTIRSRVQSSTFFCTNVELRQRVFRERDVIEGKEGVGWVTRPHFLSGNYKDWPSAFEAVTWSTGFRGLVPTTELRSIRDYVKDGVDRFINAYLSVNPR